MLSSTSPRMVPNSFWTHSVVAKDILSSFVVFAEVKFELSLTGALLTLVALSLYSVCLFPKQTKHTVAPQRPISHAVTLNQQSRLYMSV